MASLTIVGGRTRAQIEGTSKVARQQEGSLRHIPALDGLRGLAVGGVLLFHAGHLTGGYLGVDLFFVLSGFLITSLLLAEWQRSGRIKLGAFWARRARRLLPALFGVLFGVAAYAVLFAAPDELNQIRGDALATLGYVANWRAILAGNSYWAQFAAPSPLEHTWSLAIEEQFYLVWPLVVLGLLSWRRGSARRVFATCVSLAVASVVWMAWEYVPNADPSRVYLGTDTRAASLLLGAALAALIAWRGPLPGRTWGRVIEASGWMAVAGLAWAWSRVDGQSTGLYRGGLALCGLAVVAVIAAVARPEPGLLARMLSLAPLRALGIISYGVYLWHWPVYVLFDAHRTGLGDVALTTVRISATLVVATLSFYVLEQPIRRGALRSLPVLAWAPVTAVFMALAVVVATLGAAPAVEAVGAGDDPIPLLQPPAGTTKLMVVGDSIAESLADGLKVHHSGWPVQIVNRARPCTFLPDRRIVLNVAGKFIKDSTCASFNWSDDIKAYLPNKVLISVVGSDFYAHDGPCVPFYDQEYRANLVGTLTMLGARGAKVIIATIPYPAFAFFLSPAVVKQRVDCINTINRSVASQTHAGVLDLNGYFCPQGVCPSGYGNVVRPDGVHFSVAAGLTVGQWVLTQILGGPSARA
jgi:peptidoglycan/LPS O-acetylase OafA/YrhL